MGGIVFSPGSCVSPDPSSTPTPSTRRDSRLSCTKPAGKPIAAATLTVGFPIASASCYSECHSERNSKVLAPLKSAAEDLPPTNVTFPDIFCQPAAQCIEAGAVALLYPELWRVQYVQNLPDYTPRRSDTFLACVHLWRTHVAEKLREIKCTPPWQRNLLDTIGALLDAETS